MTKQADKPETAIALPTHRGSFDPQNLAEAASLATMLAKSSLIPSALRGNASDVLVILIKGHELGLSPMQAIADIAVVDGKTLLSAALIVALCAQHPEVCEFFQQIESTDLVATYETKRRGDPKSTKLSFTIEQAKNAGLLGKDNWKKYPAAMLRARASAALARDKYPDLTRGLYDPDEIDVQTRQRAPQLEQVIEVADDEVEQEVARMLLSIKEAPTMEALDSLGGTIQKLPEDARAALRGPFGERKRRLKAADSIDSFTDAMTK